MEIADGEVMPNVAFLMIIVALCIHVICNVCFMFNVWFTALNNDETYK